MVPEEGVRIVMSLSLRIFLVAAAVLTLVFVLRKIRKSQIRTADAIFWFFLMLCLAILAVFPGIAFWCSNLLGVESPVNFVFLAIIAILLIKEFITSLEMVELKVKLTQLIQAEALSERRSDNLSPDDRQISMPSSDEM